MDPVTSRTWIFLSTAVDVNRFKVGIGGVCKTVLAGIQVNMIAADTSGDTKFQVLSLGDDEV